jgi:hypothetical protein
MSKILKSSDLCGLSKAEKKKAFMRCLDAAQPVSSEKRMKELSKEIAGFEKHFNMSTNKMFDLVCLGELADRGDIADWRKAYMMLRTHKANIRA